MTIDRNILILCTLLNSLAVAQPLQFQLQPGAFPASINGWQMMQPWTGGMDASTPEFYDIDGDGDLDYFSGSDFNYYWYFENIGTINSPNFIYISSYFDSLYPVCQGTAYQSAIDFCDIDDDGDYDAFLCNGSISLSINQGNNAQYDFSPPDTLYDHYEQLLLGHHATAVDIDVDGDYDLFSGIWSTGEIRFFENRGTPQSYDFYLITSSWQNIQVTGGEADPCFADLDADGVLDLLVGTGQGKIYFYENQGTAQVPQMVLITDNFCSIDVQDDASPELADIDGDGDLDLFVGRDSEGGQSPTQGDVFFYENIGTPQAYDFQYRTSNYMTWDCGYSCTPQLVDIDADGDYDLISRIGSKLILYWNQGSVNSANFVYETSNYGGINVFNLMPCFCDIDGDGDFDLFVGTAAIPGPPGLKLYLNQGSPRNPNYVLYSNDLIPGVFNQTSVILIPGTADIDADGDYDLFVSDDNGYFYYFENTGSPTNFQFAYRTNSWQNIFVNMVHETFCFYDIDHDNDLDLFISRTYSSSDKTLRFYRNMGTPQNANMVLETDDLFPNLTIIQAAPYVIDIDGDGDGDLFVGDDCGGCRFFRNMEMENLAQIDNFTIAVFGNDVLLSWPSVSIAEVYQIYSSDNPYFTPSGAPQAVVMPPDTSWTDENAVLMGKRWYRVVVEY